MQLPLPEHEVARLEVLGRYQVFVLLLKNASTISPIWLLTSAGHPSLSSASLTKIPWLNRRSLDVDEIPRGLLSAQTILHRSFSGFRHLAAEQMKTIL